MQHKYCISMYILHIYVLHAHIVYIHYIGAGHSSGVRAFSYKGWDHLIKPACWVHL